MLNVQIDGSLESEIGRVARMITRMGPDKVSSRDLVLKVLEKYVRKKLARLEEGRKLSSYRFRLRRRQNSLCHYCGNYMHSSDTTADHVIPVIRGGKTEWSNLVACCIGCNKMKSDMTDVEFSKFQKSAVISPSEEIDMSSAFDA